MPNTDPKTLKGKSVFTALVSDSAVALCFRYGSVVCTMLFHAWLARSISQSEFGVYLLVLGAISIGEMALSLGLGEYAQRFIPSVFASSPASARGYVLLALTTAVVLGGTGALLGQLAEIQSALSFMTKEPALASTIPCATLLLAVWCMNSLVGQLLLAFGANKVSSFTYYFAPKIIVLLMVPTSLLVGVHPESAVFPVTTLILGFSLSCLVGLGVLACKTPFWRDTAIPPLFSTLSNSVPLMFSRVLQLASSWISLWVLVFFVETEEVALFGAAHRLLISVTTAFSVIVFIFRPTISRLHSDQHFVELSALCRTLASVVTAFGAAIVLISVAAGGSVLRLVYGTGYEDAHWILAILSIGFALQNVSGPALEVLRMTGNHAIAVRTQLIGSIVLFAGEAVVASFYSSYEVAYVLVGYYALTSLALMWFAYHKSSTSTLITFSPSVIRTALQA